MKQNLIDVQLFIRACMANQQYGRITRHEKLNLVCPKFNRVTEGGRSFTATSIKLWNSLTMEIEGNLVSPPSKQA